jgi:hypothetical protein
MYEVRTYTDDGIRVFIDDRKVIDAWGGATGRVNRAELHLGQGTHRVRVEYYQAWGPARLQFSLRRIGD